MNLLLVFATLNIFYLQVWEMRVPFSQTHVINVRITFIKYLFLNLYKIKNTIKMNKYV